MMRKLIILMLVFAMASAANGALSIGVFETDGTTEYDDRPLAFSENLELKIISSGGDTGAYAGICLIADTTLGTVGTTGTTNIPPAPDASLLLGSATSNEVGGMGPNDEGIVAAIDHFTLFPPFDDGVYFEDISFHCEGVADVTVYLYDIGTTWNIQDGLLDSVVIHQIPEPMTISLLGLGGLLLRKRFA